MIWLVKQFLVAGITNLSFFVCLFKLFGLKQIQDENWLAPDDKLRFDNSGCNKAPTKNIGYEKALNHGLEFRLRFKLPLASKLLEIDKAAFNYYYKQVKRDYLKNIVCKPEDKAANGKQNTRLEWIYLCPFYGETLGDATNH